LAPRGISKHHVGGKKNLGYVGNSVGREEEAHPPQGKTLAHQLNSGKRGRKVALRSFQCLGTKKPIEIGRESKGYLDESERKSSISPFAPGVEPRKRKKNPWDLGSQKPRKSPRRMTSESEGAHFHQKETGFPQE